MRREQLQVYPRGFFGAALNYAPPQPEDPSKAASSQSLNPLDFTAQLLEGGRAQLPINPDVERLYALKVNNAPQILRFDFIVNILRTTLLAFGTVNFGQWVLSQEKSPYVSWAHSEFLVDTIMFLGNKDRNLLLEMWPPMMSDKASAGEYDAAKVREALKMTGLSSLSIEEIVQIWASRDGGVWDMLTSIHILFGN